tara:strand:- start:7 stop:357 length:351 start_codon:yes stop_codon:yes gene_type:complete
MIYTNEEKLSMLKLHLALAFVDNNYSSEEEKFIGKLCDDFSIDMKMRIAATQEISNTKNEIPNICREELKKIKSTSLQEKCLVTLAELCAADHIIYEDELMLFQLIAEEWDRYIQK